MILYGELKIQKIIRQIHLKKLNTMFFLNNKKLGGFYGVNRSFDDDMYYVNYYDENNKFAYCSMFRDTKMILKPRQ